MELRHLRYFVAVAEEGSLTSAAGRRLHTAQPSVSRQIRDLELEIGVKLLERKARGIALTPAVRVFLDHARLALMQIEVACEAARGTEQPQKPPWSMRAAASCSRRRPSRKTPRGTPSYSGCSARPRRLWSPWRRLAITGRVVSPRWSRPVSPSRC